MPESAADRWIEWFKNESKDKLETENVRFLRFYKDDLIFYELRCLQTWFFIPKPDQTARFWDKTRKNEYLDWRENAWVSIYLHLTPFNLLKICRVIYKVIYEYHYQNLKTLKI